MKSRMASLIKKTGKPYTESDKLPYINNYGALELEAAAALLMLRYQYEIKAANVKQTTPPLSTATVIGGGAASFEPIAEESTPKEPMRSSMTAASQPLKKRSIPPHLLRRSLTPAKATPPPTPTPTPSCSSSSSNNSVAAIGGSTIVKAKQKATSTAACNKALLKSCRNMIREFLDNQELI
ncbi:uncharacterized protein LOC6575654 [Drosophila mojavensis]|uniref:uncharacterized protein LOC6575654 n=1 Tax=Drosophila mojavensis TaxID=7230 RepID=UPI001CD07439|nr:uncharacterized protein LOC6575654 [Drosophila mojavensis]